MYRGDTLIIDAQVVAPPAFSPVCTPPSPQNITGWFVWVTLKYLVDNPDNQAVAQVTTLPSSTPAGGIINFVNPLAGMLEAQIPPLATRGFPDTVTTLRYDVQVKRPDGLIFTVEEGIVDVWPDITQAIT